MKVIDKQTMAVLQQVYNGTLRLKQSETDIFKKLYEESTKNKFNGFVQCFSHCVSRMNYLSQRIEDVNTAGKVREYVDFCCGDSLKDIPMLIFQMNDSLTQRDSFLEEIRGMVKGKEFTMQSFILMYADITGEDYASIAGG